MVRACWLIVALLPACAGTRPLPHGDRGADSRGLQWSEGGSWLGDGPAPDRSLFPDQQRSDGPRPDAKRVDARPLDLPPADHPKPKPDQPPCPGGCDDGNACTADACVANACTHTKLGQLVHRYYNPATGAHAYGTAAGPGGFSDEGAVFRVISGAPATATIYEQTNGKDFMLSVSASEGVGCCGYMTWAALGGGFATATGGAVPLYRLYHPTMGLHLSSTDPNEGVSGGYQLEAATVHVCSP